jgi:hypothetical protein
MQEPDYFNDVITAWKPEPLEPGGVIIVQRTLILATYHATPPDWEVLANYFDANKEKRLANTIRAGIKRQSQKYGYYSGGKWVSGIQPEYSVGLRFKQGSVWKMEKALETIERCGNSSNSAAWGLTRPISHGGSEA